MVIFNSMKLRAIHERVCMSWCWEAISCCVFLSSKVPFVRLKPNIAAKYLPSCQQQYGRHVLFRSMFLILLGCVLFHLIFDQTNVFCCDMQHAICATSMQTTNFVQPFPYILNVSRFGQLVITNFIWCQIAFIFYYPLIQFYNIKLVNVACCGIPCSCMANWGTPLFRT